MNTLKIHHKKDYAILELARGKANPINVQMMQELCQAMEELTTDASVRGVVITGQPHFFSVGLDVKALAELDKNSSTEFFQSFGRMIFDLVRFPKPLVAAITGHSPAGGCIIAITCDYRIMAEEDSYRIGLNEVPVGIMVPGHVHELYSFWIGRGPAYQYLLEGKLHSSAEALACGLVNELAPMTDVLKRAEAYLSRILQADSATLMGVKINLRHGLIKRMIEMAKDTPVDTETHFWRPSSQERLRKVLDQIAK